MATHLRDRSKKDLPDASGMTFGIIRSTWNSQITDALMQGCMDTLIKAGASAERITTMDVPGAFELTSGARMMLEAKTPDAVICLGCVIKGETSHNEYINHAVANGLTALGQQYNKPVIFGVLTPNNSEQAAERAGGALGNKGEEAAEAALIMIANKRALQ